jgi:type I restriction-modification system DNA methylase subunit
MLKRIINGMTKKIKIADKVINYKKEFMDILENIKPSKNAYEIFSDWLVIAAAGLYAWKEDKKVEKEYKEVAKNYSKDEMDKHAQLLAITVNALEEKEQDFLGEIFIEGEFSNDKKAQIFTPYHISQMMSKMIIGIDELQKDEVFTVFDPCCGSGVMLIAAISEMKEQGFNYQQYAFFSGIDIDARCARMTYIQLSLLGAPAVITCGNTLSKETFWERETIGYIISGMNFKLRNWKEKKKKGNNLKDEKQKIKETRKSISIKQSRKSKEPDKAEEPEVIYSSDDNVQGELF